MEKPFFDVDVVILERGVDKNVANAFTVVQIVTSALTQAGIDPQKINEFRTAAIEAGSLSYDAIVELSKKWVNVRHTIPRPAEAKVGTRPSF